MSSPDYSDNYLSTSALARLMGMQSKKAFSILERHGYLEKINGQWQLTRLGETNGGKYGTLGGPAKFPIWPRSLSRSMILKSSQFSHKTTQLLYLECEKCGHKTNISFEDEKRLRIEAKDYFYADFLDVFKKIKNRLKCKGCNAKGHVKLEEPSLARTQNRNISVIQSEKIELKNANFKKGSKIDSKLSEICIAEKNDSDHLDRQLKAERLLIDRKSMTYNDLAIDKPHNSDTTCIDCGANIPESRLMAIPDATRCVHCQSALESANPILSERRIDEGLVGSREGHKRMRAQQWKGRRRR